MTHHPDPSDEAFVSQRPWGSFHQFVANQPVTVKIITVDPGQRLSLQTHQGRSEYWHVLDGPMVVTVGSERREVGAGDSVWVPVGSQHRMANEGDRPARMLEIAYGTFDEDDIVRIEDDYRR